MEQFGQFFIVLSFSILEVNWKTHFITFAQDRNCQVICLIPTSLPSIVFARKYSYGTEGLNNNLQILDMDHGGRWKFGQCPKFLTETIP